MGFPQQERMLEPSKHLAADQGQLHHNAQGRIECISVSSGASFGAILQPQGVLSGRAGLRQGYLRVRLP